MPQSLPIDQLIEEFKVLVGDAISSQRLAKTAIIDCQDIVMGLFGADVQPGYRQ